MIIDELVTNRTPFSVELVNTIRTKIKNRTASTDEYTQYTSMALSGAYTADDLNRVSTAQVYLAGLFNAFPSELRSYLDAAIDVVEDSLIFPAEYYDLDGPVLPDELADVDYETVTLETAKTDWNAEDIPQLQASIAYYLNNINTLRSVIPVTAPTTPSDLDDLNYAEANNIETILTAVYNALIAYEQTKKEAVDAARSTAIDEYRLQAAAWWNSGEIFVGEV